MSQTLPTALPYETPKPNEFFWWRVLRLGVIAWALLILARHGLWYGGQLGNLSIPAAVFAGVEGIILLFVLAWALMLRTPKPRRLLGLAGLCGFWMAVNLIAFGIDLILNRGGFSPVFATWQFVSRMQLWVVPGLVLLCAARFPAPDVNHSVAPG